MGLKHDQIKEEDPDFCRPVQRHQTPSCLQRNVPVLYSHLSFSTVLSSNPELPDVLRHITDGWREPPPPV